MQDPHHRTTDQAGTPRPSAPGDHVPSGPGDGLADGLVDGPGDHAPVAQATAPPAQEPCPAYQWALDRLLTTGRWEDSDPPGMSR